MVPKTRAVQLERRIEELERAWAQGAGGGHFEKALRDQGHSPSRGDLKWLHAHLHCSIALCCQVLGRSRGWFYYRHQRPGRRWPSLHPHLGVVVRQVLATCPPSYGYRRIHARLGRGGMRCNPKTVLQVATNKQTAGQPSSNDPGPARTPAPRQSHRAGQQPTLGLRYDHLGLREQGEAAAGRGPRLTPTT